MTLTEVYFECFINYSDNLAKMKDTLMGVAAIATVISLILLILLVIYVIREQGYLRDIANLVKTDSYINEDNLISDK